MFIPGQGAKCIGDDYPANMMKDEALQRVLHRYYLVASRLAHGAADGRPTVDCRGEGVGFAEANAEMAVIWARPVSVGCWQACAASLRIVVCGEQCASSYGSSIRSSTIASYITVKGSSKLELALAWFRNTINVRIGHAPQNFE
ncbi:hypothetical protein L7F22_061907 [Adiantum nelumboides]|nr:hypothetical protein [Adiantum nelumboides]